MLSDPNPFNWNSKTDNNNKTSASHKIENQQSSQPKLNLKLNCQYIELQGHS